MQHVSPDQMLTLSDLRGKTVILAFYPADWSPICADQVTRYNDLLSDFHKHSAETLKFPSTEFGTTRRPSL
ncbi:peroxiredoxin [Bradyrhizobium sp. USDA 4509]